MKRKKKGSSSANKTWKPKSRQLYSMKLKLNTLKKMIKLSLKKRVLLTKTGKSQSSNARLNQYHQMWRFPSSTKDSSNYLIT